MGPTKYFVSKEMFAGQLDKQQERNLFKKSVSRVTLEVSSYCNRQCVFCPNSAGIRLSKSLINSPMDAELFEFILEDLASIDYDKSVLLHLFNEPMADPNIVDKVRHVRRMLPKSYIFFNTNGDYLSYQKVRALAEAGLSNLEISLYGPNHGQFDEEYLKKRFENTFKSLETTGKITKISPHEIRSFVRLDFGGFALPISIIAKNFSTIGYDRAQSVDVKKSAVRMSPCSSVFNEFNVAWNGDVVPCCNINPDDKQHKKYVIGKVRERGDIFQLFSSNIFRQWRQDLADFTPCMAPCNTCTRGDFTALFDTPDGREYRAMLAEYEYQNT